MWTESDQVITDLPYPHVFYDIDTSGGQSGAAVDETDDPDSCGSDCAIAIHTYGTNSFSAQPTLNSGNRITEDILNDYVSWSS